MDGLMESWRRQRFEARRPQNAGLIPTWQVGQEQPQGSAMRRYVTEGYGKSSLLFSCIAEKATSFAALEAQVVRANGQVAGRHRLAQLLADPNPYQDGQDFGELLMSQYEAAGNAFVAKRRVSGNAARRREWGTFPVQELELIRPDYVQIEPGPTRDRDLFVVRVAGEEKERIPREDMIHIHEPLLINDFYGESKLSRLTREADIDLQMSDFELSFFRNAGVPMGLLQVKGSVNEEERKAIKSKFRSAYNGLKHWFDLLVLNSDQATYTPMGLKQDEMEMDSTRFHVESRVCSVFGVPGIIVGARFALQQPTPIEEAEHQFWAETMVPASLRFARAWTKFLLPEFAVGADRGAQVGYDFTVVRALQEDRSRKLREVVRLVLTGGFTVNQALQIVGLPAIEAGDFYIRNGNQVVVSLDGTVTPMAPSAGGGPNPDNPLEGAAVLRQAVEEAERLTIFKR
jgi:HK97 family phage portal protein